ncbi:MAG TPA: AGE family epimerase/isomerase [Pyrinomonadaceae bacterium]|nr:AGE family epimerase/isomerase [Pyrinomonadaceae bacterium]
MLQRALEWNALLRDRMLPYWHNTTINSRGGYQVYDSGDRSWRAQIKSAIKGDNDRGKNESLRGLISQARLLWVFSHAHVPGYSTLQHDYLKAAAHGYSYLIETMLDREYGGCYWKTDVNRGVVEPHKIFYGQAMTIYALVEYHRASGLSEPLEYARSVYETVQQSLRDKIHGGWTEHCERDFTPLTCTGERLPGMPDIVGFKSGDALLHWMEALTELYSEVHDTSVRDSLVEAIELLCTKYYPPNVSEACEYRLADWKAVDELSGVSHGHTLEFAWLLLHAQQALGIPRDWDHFEILLRHSLRYGFDRARGGFYFRGKPYEPACDTTKFWWVQAEGLSALTDAVAHFDSDEYHTALTQLVDWIFNYQIRSDDGVWIVSTDSAGRPLNVKKAGEWKAAYHEVRAITKFVHAFAPQSRYDRCQQ